MDNQRSPIDEGWQTLGDLIRAHDIIETALMIDYFTERLLSMINREPVWYIRPMLVNAKYHAMQLNQSSPWSPTTHHPVYIGREEDYYADKS